MRDPYIQYFTLFSIFYLPFISRVGVIFFVCQIINEEIDVDYPKLTMLVTSTGGQQCNANGKKCHQLFVSWLCYTNCSVFS